MTRPCANPECCQPFEPKTASLRYCSPACMFRARYLRHAAREVAAGTRANPPIDHRNLRVCAYSQCEQTFRPRHPLAAYCCPEHKYQSLLERLRKGPRQVPEAAE